MKFGNLDLFHDQAQAIASRPDGIAQAKTELLEYNALLHEAQKAQQNIQDEMTAAQAGLGDLLAWLARRQKDFGHSAREKWAESVLNPAADISGLAHALQKTKAEIDFANDAIQHARRVVLPQLDLRLLEAKINELSVRSDIAWCEAVLSAAKRHEAAKALTALGEVVTFEPMTGATGSLYENARRAYVQAFEAQKSFDAATAAHEERIRNTK